jgi:hypothetical protein
MKDRDVILFGIGFFAVFLILKLKKGKEIIYTESSDSNLFSENAQNSEEKPNQILATSEESLDSPKISYCKQNWIKFAETRKFSSSEQEQKTYDNFMTSCVAQLNNAKNMEFNDLTYGNPFHDQLGFIRGTCLVDDLFETFKDSM